MIVTKRGRPRQITDEQYRRVVEWKRQTLRDLAKELGIPERMARAIRNGYTYKQVSP